MCKDYAQIYNLHTFIKIFLSTRINILFKPNSKNFIEVYLIESSSHNHIKFIKAIRTFIEILTYLSTF